MEDDMLALRETVLRLLENKQDTELREMLLTPSAAELASLFGILPEEKRPHLFRLLPKEEAALLFVEMDGDVREGLLRAFSDDEVRRVVDDAIDVLKEEAEEDIAILSAVTPEDKPYLKRSVGELYRARIPWLLLLMLSATLTGAIISAYEAALANMVILTAFIPMLMGTGGNAGGQSSVTVIRALSLKEIGFSDLLSVIFKELRVALLAGLTLAGVNALKMLWIDRLSFGVVAAVCLTLWAVVVIAKLAGCILPLLAKKIGLDPAVMAGPFVTTAVDALTLLVYFALASALLPI